MGVTKELICPVMTAGWLSNREASRLPTEEISTMSIQNMVPCMQENCPLWDKKGSVCNLGARNKNSE
jgi:hypothetical protein